jgi:hypothetical protein
MPRLSAVGISSLQAGEDVKHHRVEDWCKLFTGYHLHYASRRVSMRFFKD